jgi:hypothetical protein
MSRRPIGPQLLLLVASGAYYCDYDAEVTRFDALNGFMASDVNFVCSAEMTLILSNVHAPSMTRVYAQSMDDRTTVQTRSSRYLLPEIQHAMVSALTNVTQLEPSLDGKCERISYYQRGKVKLKWVMEYIRFPQNQEIAQAPGGMIDVEVNFKMMSTSCEVCMRMTKLGYFSLSVLSIIEMQLGLRCSNIEVGGDASRTCFPHLREKGDVESH